MGPCHVPDTVQDERAVELSTGADGRFAPAAHCHVMRTREAKLVSRPLLGIEMVSIGGVHRMRWTLTSSLLNNPSSMRREGRSGC